MSRSFINTLVCAVALLASCAVSAQEQAQEVAVKPWKAQRLHANYEGWKRALPTHLKVQYAGGMGIASAGFGWDFGRSNQLETDFHVGFLPVAIRIATMLSLPSSRVGCRGIFVVRIGSA